MKSNDDRLEKIKHGNFFAEKLTYDDLCLILSQDSKIQSLIRQCALNNQELNSTGNQSIKTSKVENVTETERVVDFEKLIAVEKIVEVEKVIEVDKLIVKPDPIRAELSLLFLTIKTLLEDSELSLIFRLNSRMSESQQLTTFIIQCALFITLEQLWETIVRRCKADARCATAAEKALAIQVVSLHNQSYVNDKYSVVDVPSGDDFDYENHQRLNSRGDIVTELAFYGLNKEQQIEYKPLVETKS
ncbi:hypothetical protein [Moritella sp. Urea-trap-13]|uniref:hypothetical protein n=1 Tax=Moritella sp. Urea-trap-13 TaxID=2058327 RepID=UPI000C34A3DE|nr:hypothetical protein [Moritella sp. Urea-trap-13]PKH07128.1 hypothetical protein CXF93_14775 [Moritella sp. Urea-trap-13]